MPKRDLMSQIQMAGVKTCNVVVKGNFALPCGLLPISSRSYSHASCPSSGGQYNNRVQSPRVLGQAPVAHRHMPGLTLDDTEKVYYLGTNTNVGPLKQIQGRAHCTDILSSDLRLSGRIARRHVPADFDPRVCSRLITPW